MHFVKIDDITGTIQIRWSFIQVQVIRMHTLVARRHIDDIDDIARKAMASPNTVQVASAFARVMV